MKYGGKAAKGTGKAVLATGKNVGEAALHPSQTLRGAGQAVKTAAVGGAIGYVGWEKLTTDKSVVRIVSDAVIGEPAPGGTSGYESGRQNGAMCFEMRRRENKTKRKNEK